MKQGGERQRLYLSEGGDVIGQHGLERAKVKNLSTETKSEKQWRNGYGACS